MSDIVEEFFKAYWTPGMKYVYRKGVSKEMMQSAVDENGWYEWQPILGTLTMEDYKSIENRYNVTLPENFISWHKRYYFDDGDCSIVRLPYSLPGYPLAEIANNLIGFEAEQLISLGLVPFADEGNDTGPLVFDTRNQNSRKDFPIRVYDHEYGAGFDGLSETIFSSFNKMLECLTHFLTETKARQPFEVIPDFFVIDPIGAGSSGRSYWTTWTEMLKANFEEFGY